MKAFVMAPKGAVQFPNNKPLPYELIKEIVMFRVSEQSGAAQHSRIDPYRLMRRACRRCCCVSGYAVNCKGDAQAKQFILGIDYIKLVEVAPRQPRL